MGTTTAPSSGVGFCDDGDGSGTAGDNPCVPGAASGAACDDNCPNDANPGQADADGDGVGDACDLCPIDPGKIAPGVCGCGIPDTDTDGDGTPDCNDGCPNDPGKIAPGVCGCGIPDTDTDGDGTLDCNDECPNDSDKTAPGVCGCGNPDTDTDGNGVANCVDDCPGDADIFVSANKHTVGSGSNPGSTKEPFVGIEVCAYDKSDGSCARQQDLQGDGISHQEYEAIAANCAPVNCCTTDLNGECTIHLPPGDYIVISVDTTKTVLPDPLGVSASDLLCGELKRKHLQQIVKADGKKVPGKTTRRTGSELLIIEQEYVVWDSTAQLYPFVFETVGDWNVTATVLPPEGFLSDFGSLTADIFNEIGTVQFTVTEVGSDLVPTGTTFEVWHRGRREVIRSQVDIFLTPDYARSRGFDVAALRASGLIKEHPCNKGRRVGHRRAP